MKRAHLDKTRLYGLLLKIVDASGAGSPGPAGPQGPAGPAGLQGPACVCGCEHAPIVKKTVVKKPKSTQNQ